MEGTRHSAFDFPEDPILQEMVDKYPRLFHGSAPRSHSWVEPGWKGIVDDLCFRIDGMLTDHQASMFEMLQVKEKLGTLRFYYSLSRDVDPLDTERDSTRAPETGHDRDDDPNMETAEAIHAAIEEAIDLLSRTCSVCSRPGRMRSPSEISVRCDDHSSVA